MHFVNFLNYLAYAVIAGFLIRFGSARWPDNAFSKAFAFVI